MSTSANTDKINEMLDVLDGEQRSFLEKVLHTQTTFQTQPSLAIGYGEYNRKRHADFMKM